jgi:AcrR family transcriptional regulator
LKPQHNRRTDSVEKLVAAGVALLGTTGHDGVTIRAVAAQAGFSVAAVQHHFPSKERLLNAVYAQALQQDVAAAQALEQLLGAPPNDESGVLRILDGALAISCGAAAARTAARNEALLGIARQHGPYRLVQHWRGHRQAGLARLLGTLCAEPRAAARMLLELLLGLELLSLGCREHPLTPQLNGEVLSYGLSAALGRARDHCPDWLEHAVSTAVREQREALAAAPVGRDRGARARILDAAAQLLCERGATALNHRSAAQQAGLAVSVVSYHFRTKSDLLYGAFQHIRSEITRFSLAANPLAQGVAQMPLPHAVVDLQFGSAPAYLGMLEAVIAAATDAELADFAWKTRILRGVYHLFLERPEDYRFDAAAFNRYVFSSWSAGATLLAQASWQPARLTPLLHDRLERVGSLFPAA